MSAAHTPGPDTWRIEFVNGNKKRPVIVSNATGGRITYIDDDMADTDHARLIAAAPETAARRDEFEGLLIDALFVIEHRNDGANLAELCARIRATLAKVQQ